LKFKGWLFVRKTERTVLRFYHASKFVALRNTLLYNILKMFALIIILLGIIFRIAPSSAHVSYVADTIEALGNITADHIAMNLETNRMSVSCNEPIELYCLGSGGIIVDDITYNEPYRVIFEPYSPELGGEIFISRPGSSDMQFEIRSFFRDDILLVFISYMSSTFSAECRTGFQIVQREKLHLTFTGGDAFLINDADEKIPVWYCLLTNKESLNYVMGFKNNATVNIHNYLDQDVHSNGSIDISGISAISSKGYGVLDFSYLPTPANFSLNSQYVRLHSKNNQLRASITFDESLSKVDINGMVNEASISGMSLFPSFFGWFRDTVYLAPITLITTIFGGVTLMLNSKKKN